MAIIIKKKERVETVNYPKLMQSDNGHIFYMVRENYGLPLTENVWNYELRNFADFSESGYIFTDYNESITIQNKTN